MKVTDRDVAYVADLANLELTGAEQKRMVKDLNSILDYIDRLNEVDTTAIEPMAQISDRYGISPEKVGTARLAYAVRDDVVHGLRPSLPHDEALHNAPQTDGTCFKVPKVIER